MHEDTKQVSSKFTLSPGNITLATINTDLLRLKLYYQDEDKEYSDQLNSQNSLKATKVVFSQYTSPKPARKAQGLELHVKYNLEDINQQMIQFRQKDLQMDLNSITYETSLLKHTNMTYKVDTFNTIVGNTFEYLIEPESQLEKISDVIKMIGHSTYVG